MPSREETIRHEAGRSRNPTQLYQLHEYKTLHPQSWKVDPFPSKKYLIRNSELQYERWVHPCPPLREIRAVAGIVLRLIEEIRASRILENPTFGELRLARDLRFQQRGSRASVAEWQSRVREEEGGEREESVRFRATQARYTTLGNLGEIHSRQTAAVNVGQATSEAGSYSSYASEETTRRRLYETPERRAAVLEMKSGRRCPSGTGPTNEAIIPMMEDAAHVNNDSQTLENHSAFQLASIPSDEEISLAKLKVQYVEGLFHFAVTGVSGAGKSSLINAFRGLRNRDQGAAPTGVVETTTNVTRFPDPNPKNPFVWYDVPGSGTLSTPDWQYFNTQGLYVFDCIVILFDMRFTMTDLAMLVNCRRLNIPTYIVRSKSDSHIRNIMKDSGYDSDEDEDNSDRNALYRSAREQYIAETRATVKCNLQEAGLPDQRVYIVAHSTMVSTVREEKLSEKTIDELELMRDLFKEALSRRCVSSRSPT